MRKAEEAAERARRKAEAVAEAKREAAATLRQQKELMAKKSAKQAQLNLSRLQDFYATYDPEKVRTASMELAQHKGREKAFFDHLDEEYIKMPARQRELEAKQAAKVDAAQRRAAAQGAAAG
jgi:hypothetical protein